RSGLAENRRRSVDECHHSEAPTDLWSQRGWKFQTFGEGCPSRDSVSVCVNTQSSSFCQRAKPRFLHLEESFFYRSRVRHLLGCRSGANFDSRICEQNGEGHG